MKARTPTESRHLLTKPIAMNPEEIAEGWAVIVPRYEKVKWLERPWL